jgi:CubicO group peptidase (beta-lactamase class C family)
MQPGGFGIGRTCIARRTDYARTMSFDEFDTPPEGAAWQPGGAQAAGFDQARLAAAIAFAEQNEIGWSRDIADQLGQGEFEPPPWNEVLGPTGVRGGPAGVIVKRGRMAAQWGDPDRTDQTFSVAKSYLAVLAGIAWKDGLFADVDEPVAQRLPEDEAFTGAHNGAVTWRQLLQQTSEWRGTVWDKPDQIDHNRQLGPYPDNSRKGQLRELQAPGGHWEYNDVRVNLLSRTLMRLFRRPLPEVLAERVMAPIGASSDWAWRGYRNATEEIGGRAMEGVPGGTHWGGGLYIGARDQARMGQLILQGGRWGGREIVSADWVQRMLTPCPQNHQYGFMWWLNGQRDRHQMASARAVSASGAGGNTILVEPVHDLIIVSRWLAPQALNALVEQVIEAIEP